MSDQKPEVNASDVQYEVDDKVTGQLSNLNKGFLGKPQFWCILLVVVIIIALIYRRQQNKRENQNNQSQENDEENQNLPEASAQNNQEEIQPVKAEDEHVVDNPENK